ncbi:MAG: DNA-binding protein [Marinilabiliaceae bacterium]|nr:DNA-binding protein [Marinilabiliaceae bacterium]
MSTTITFNQLRRIKDSLPKGSIRSIAESLGLNVETVRNYFGGADYVRGHCIGIHIEQGPDGGVVELDDPTILLMAHDILKGKIAVPIYNF